MARKSRSAVPPEAAGPIESTAEAAIASRARAFVFISHDSRDADLAEAFANLLSDVSAGTLKSFRSSDKKSTSGIEFGTEWYKAIMSQLGDATDVVALLTQRSVDRPWILYEAGVAKGKLETNVLGVALGVPLEKVSTGPFGQFQNCGGDDDSLTKLVIQLLQRNPEAAPREEAVRRQVQAFRENVERLLVARGKQAGQPATEESSAAKLFEEVKAMVRELPERVDDRVRSVTRRGQLRKGRRFHPMMFEEFLFHPALHETPQGPATAWLLFISSLRDDFPWLYELGIELYHALRSGSPRRLSEAREEFLSTIEVTMRSKFIHEMFRPDDEEIFLMARHIPEIARHFLSKLSLDRSRNRSEQSKKVDAAEKPSEG